MKIENIEDAAKAVADYRRIVAEWEQRKGWESFQLLAGPDRNTMQSITGESIVHPRNTSGSYQMLAAGLYDVMKHYYEFHIDAAEQRLKQLGVEIAE